MTKNIFFFVIGFASFIILSTVVIQGLKNDFIYDRPWFYFFVAPITLASVFCTTFFVYAPRIIFWTIGGIHG